MAKLLGISRSYLANLEAGRKNVGENIIKKMAESSGLSMLYLTTGKKTVNDLNDDEMKEQLESFSKMIKNSNDSVKLFVEENLKNLLESELEYVEENYLLHSLIFLQKSNREDLMMLAAIINQLNRYKDIGLDDDTNQDELLKFIEGESQEYENFLKRYYGYKEAGD